MTVVGVHQMKSSRVAGIAGVMLLLITCFTGCRNAPRGGDSPVSALRRQVDGELPPAYKLQRGELPEWSSPGPKVPLLLIAGAERMGTKDLLVRLEVWNPSETQWQLVPPINVPEYCIEFQNRAGMLEDVYGAYMVTFGPLQRAHMARVPPRSALLGQFLIRGFYDRADSRSGVSMRVGVRRTVRVNSSNDPNTQTEPFQLESGWVPVPPG